MVTDEPEAAAARGSNSGKPGFGRERERARSPVSFPPSGDRPAIPMVPVLLNTCYPPNQPGPDRCFALGLAIREFVAGFPEDVRVGILASGGLSHFLVNEELDLKVVDAIKQRDFETSRSLPTRLLHTGSSEIRNWICVAAAAQNLDLRWISYVPAYRSRAMTRIGLCFANWKA